MLFPNTHRGNFAVTGKGDSVAFSPTNYGPCRGFFKFSPIFTTKLQNASLNNGLFPINKSYNFSAVTDGLSNTFAYGERAAYVNGQYAGGGYFWPGPVAVGAAQHTSSQTAVKLNQRQTSTNGNYSSGHVGGANFTYADGSVHFISELIEFKKLTADGLGTLDASIPTTATPPDDDMSYFNAYQESVSAGNVGLYQLLGSRDDGATTNSGF
jgi:prepilin-type processing-associated H-X9-DG protein